MTMQHPKYRFLKTLPILFLAFFLILSCKEKNAKEVTTALSPASDTNDKIRTGWPKPDSYADGIPVYDKFDGLEPLFQFDNDTTYVVNFWATWCKPCIQELPYFEELNSQHSNKKVKVVLVSLDFPKQVESNLVPFVQKKQLQSKVVVLLDGKYNDWIDKVSSEWSGAIPATYIYKGSQNSLVGEPFENFEELNEAVQAFL